MSLIATFQDALLKHVSNLEQERTDLLAGGTAPDYSAYREGVGYITALRDVIRVIDDLNRRINKS